jgi:hypothetical protein
VVAVGHEQHVVALGLALVGRDLPAVGGLLGAGDARLEADPVAEAEVVDVGVEVGGDLRVVREVRVGLRHREVRVLHPLARGVDVEMPVGGRHPVRVLEDPVAADAVARLVGVEGDPPLVQGLGGGDAGRAGADQAGGGQGGHDGWAPGVLLTKMTQASP